MFYIRCSRLISPGKVISDAFIVVDGNKIVAFGREGEVNLPAHARQMDMTGLTAVPGYMDWQLNGGFGYDFTQNPEHIWEVGARLPEHGVTSFLPTIISASPEVYSAAQEVMRKGPPQNYCGAEPLGLHFEGPFLNPAKKGAHNPAFLRQPTPQIIRDWSRKNHVWLVTLAPELPGAGEVAHMLRSRKVVISFGHTLASYEQAQLSIQNGIRVATHLFNAMPVLDHRAPGLIAVLLNSKQVALGIIPDGVHVHPAMVKLAWNSKVNAKLTIVTDAMSALGMMPGEYRLNDFKVIVDETSARLENGTLAGSILRMDQAVRNLMDFTNCSLQAAVTAATKNVAKLVRAPNKGEIRPGAIADLVFLDSSARVNAVMVAGEMMHVNHSY